MILEVVADSPVPPYEQIRQQIAAMVGGGVLPEGTRLPTIRQLARDLGVASGTAARAYRELETERVIVTRGRRGTFVLGAARRPAPNAVSLLEDAVRSLVVRARQLGLDEDRTVAAVRDAFASATAE